MSSQFSVGIDFGTNSVRTLIADVNTGEELATAVWNYEHGEAGVLVDPSDPHLARQHPADYLKGLEISVKKALARAASLGVTRENVVGIGVDTTGSTPIPVDRNGTPLAFRKEFQNNLNAMAWLWKDHTSHEEAVAITEKARSMRPRYLTRCGGTYSSEWFFSKIWHCKRVDPDVFKAAFSWVELADYIPATLVGNTDPLKLLRGVCPAGHKAMYCEEWGGLPDAEFLGALDKDLGDLHARLYSKAYAADRKAGGLHPEAAETLNLKPGTPVAVGAFDAHTGGVGAGIREGTLVKVIGTSTCDMAVLPNTEKVPEIPGLCGIVDGSILPGYYGFEAGQSAVGDIFNWFIERGAGAGCEEEARRKGKDLHEYLSESAARLAPGESGLLALDWHNGNRTILVDPRLTGLMLGMTLHTTAAEQYRAWIEATAFGARTIAQRLMEYGVPVKEVICCGGIAEKNPLFMQIYADVFNMPMKVSRSAQTCALGAAVFGAVVGGIYRRAEEAQERMTGVKEQIFTPKPSSAKIYQRLFSLYSLLHDSFGLQGTQPELSRVMKDLLEIKKMKDEGEGLNPGSTQL